MSLQHMKLSSLDQLMVRGIGRMIFCYPTQKTIQEDEVINVLHKGLANTAISLPFITGWVQPEIGVENNSVEVVYPREPTAADILGLITIKNLKNVMPSYRELAAKKVPLSYLQEDKVSPFPDRPDPNDTKSPVFRLQANFIKGGILLCICVHHSVFDLYGMGSFLVMYMQNINRKFGFDLPWSSHHFDRSECSKGLRKGIGIINKHEREYDNRDPSWAPKGLDMVATSRLFYFSGPRLERLKAMASPPKLEMNGKKTKWISTNDALCALLWTAVARARFRPVKDGKYLASSSPGFPVYGKDEVSKFGLGINCRNRLKKVVDGKKVLATGDDYMGNCTITNVAVAEIDKLISDDVPLSTFASEIRKTVDEVDDHHVRELISVINSKDDVSDVSRFKQNIFPPYKDLFLTTWKDFPAYDVEVCPGLGKPEFIRCPFRTLPGLCKVLPQKKAQDKGWEVNVELGEEHMEKLLQDPRFMEFARVIEDDGLDQVRGCC